MKLLRDLESHSNPDEYVRIGKPESTQRRRLDCFGFLPDAGLVGRDFELNAPPGHAPQFEDEVETTWFDELARHVDDLDRAASQCQRTPRLRKHLLENPQEFVQ